MEPKKVQKQGTDERTKKTNLHLLYIFADVG